MSVDETPLTTLREAAARFGLDPADVLYVGDSPVADVLGARSAGMPVAWLNRLGVPRPEKAPEPDMEAPDLTALADLLLAGTTEPIAQPDRP